MATELAVQPDLTTKEQGDALENAIEYLFKSAGFDALANTFIAGYQIDVLAQLGDRKIVIECKNYQRSSMIIRNLIHEWKSKNEIIRAHKIILVLVGLNVKPSDYELADELDIEIWTQDVISEFFNLSLRPNELKAKILEKVDFTPIKINERYRDQIVYLAIKPHLSKFRVTDELLCQYFNRWLRAFVLTELQFRNPTSEERAKHIELFEDTKTKKALLFTVKRKEVDYWNTLMNKLSGNTILNNEQQQRYLSYMNLLEDEYTRHLNFFKTGDFLSRFKNLLYSRIFHALINDEDCNFKADNMANIVKVRFILENGVYRIFISEITENQAYILNWIMTSQFNYTINKADHKPIYYWVCNNYKEAVEKVYRVFIEYLEISEREKVVDLSIIE